MFTASQTARESIDYSIPIGETRFFNLTVMPGEPRSNDKETADAIIIRHRNEALKGSVAVVRIPRLSRQKELSLDSVQQQIERLEDTYDDSAEVLRRIVQWGNARKGYVTLAPSQIEQWSNLSIPPHRQSTFALEFPQEYQKTHIFEISAPRHSGSDRTRTSTAKSSPVRSLEELPPTVAYKPKFRCILINGAAPCHDQLVNRFAQTVLKDESVHPFAVNTFEGEKMLQKISDHGITLRFPIFDTDPSSPLRVVNRSISICIADSGILIHDPHNSSFLDSIALQLRENKFAKRHLGSPAALALEILHQAAGHNHDIASLLNYRALTLDDLAEQKSLRSEVLEEDGRELKRTLL